MPAKEVRFHDGARTRMVHGLNILADAVMITLQADFDHMDPQGRLRLDDLRMHRQTPFAEFAAKQGQIIFVDAEDMVRGELVHDPELGWIGKVDWSTRDVWESCPPAVAARG